MLKSAQDLNIRLGTQGKTIVIADKKEYYFVFTSLTKLSTGQTKLGTNIHRKNKNI